MQRIHIVLLALLLPAMSLWAGEPAFVARWNFSSATREAGVWQTAHAVPDNGAVATLSFEGADPVYGYTKKGSVKVRQVRPGDGFIFSAPVAGLPEGTDIDLGLYIGMDKEGTSSWVVEYLDGRRWRDTGLGLTISKGPHSNETSFIGTFTLRKAFKGNVFKVRLRCTELDAAEDAAFYFMTGIRRAAYFAAWPSGGDKPMRVLMLGNSYTFFGASHFALLEIAHSQGHRLDVGVNVKGGQNFLQHLALDRSRAVIAAGGYEAALLQNQSQASAFYASDPERYLYIKLMSEAMAAEVREYSPDCRLILEWTWASPKNDWNGHGSAEVHDSLLEKGTVELAAAMGADISPIGRAFTLGRAEGLPLYYTDDFHQGELGSYLKACVNYLVLFGGPFGEDVSDCGLDPAQTARCREIAMKVVQP